MEGKNTYFEELNEIRSMFDIFESHEISHQPSEFFYFVGLSPQETGLKVNIYLDQGQSYKKNRHPLWIYISNGYIEDAEYIRISVSPIKVYNDMRNIKIFHQDLSGVISFLLTYRNEIKQIADEELDIDDFIKKLSQKEVQGMICENKTLLTEMSKLKPETTGLPFTTWIGINPKSHGVGVKFPIEGSSTNSDDFAEMAVCNCVVHSSKKYDTQVAKYVMALIKANKEQLLELGNHPEKYNEITRNLTKINANCEPVVQEPLYYICGKTTFGITKVKDKNNKYNFIDSNHNVIFPDKWFDVANDFTCNKQNTIRAYTMIDGEEGYLYLDPIRWEKI